MKCVKYKKILLEFTSFSFYEYDLIPSLILIKKNCIKDTNLWCICFIYIRKKCGQQKSKLSQIDWNGEKIDQQLFSDSPPPQLGTKKMWTKKIKVGQKWFIFYFGSPPPILGLKNLVKMKKIQVVPNWLKCRENGWIT